MTVVEQDLLNAVKHFEGIKAAVFDMDGLIFDTERLFMEQLAIVMKEQGYVLSKKIYCETLGIGGEPLKEIMCSYFGEAYPFSEMGKKAEEKVRMVAETVGLVIKPRIPEVLCFLKEKGILCAIASTTNSNAIKHYLKSAGILSYFQEIVGGEMVKKSKPEPDIFLLACKRLNLEPNQCVVLEDSEYGVRAAKRAGCSVICVPDLKQPSDEVIEMADYLVSCQGKQ